MSFPKLRLIVTAVFWALVVFFIVAFILSLSGCGGEPADAKIDGGLDDVSLYKRDVRGIPCIVAVAGPNSEGVSVSCDWSR